ncbi:MAG: selenide, water dikinase SelD [Gammaproteobacteria bacterium]|nr:selenide, water dikinase SelD [Gammaproteobacteria bacterium]
MNDSRTPARRHLVLAGGGHSHVAVLKHFGMRPTPGLALTLVSRATYAPYSGMLPGLIAGHYDFDACHIDLRRLARFAGADFVQADVESVEPENQRLYVSDRPSLHYDFLSLNIGAQPAVPPADERAARVFPVKPADVLLGGCRELRRLAQARNGRIGIAVVGGGAGGVELMLALHHGLARESLGERWDWRIVTDQAEILIEHNHRVRARFVRVLATRGIEVITGERVTAVEPPGLRCDSGRAIAADFVMWATAVAAPEWLSATGLDLDARGFVRIDARLRSTSHPNVYAAGDVAGSMETPRPKSGVYAVRQGAVLAANLRRHHEHRRLKAYRPQTRALALISTGDRYAVASRAGLYAAGGWLWRVKDGIDRRWMAKYNDLPSMREPRGATSGAHGEADVDLDRKPAMRCGGCGAKVGGAVLKRVLKRVARGTGEDIDIGLEAMDDAAVFTPPAGLKLVQSIDYFRDFINDPFLLGEIAANHALSDLYAMGARPHSALALATLPYAGERVMEEQLYQLMAGAVRTLDTAGAALLGGHSGEGAELAIGFSVNGVIDADDLARRRMLAPGQVLILTKPLGIGALFAADMRHRAQGRWIDLAVAMMRQSSALAADCLRAHHASACTDVTGFGLIGHLLALLRPSGLGADIQLAALPLLEGALDCAAAGIVSSLQPQNARLDKSIADADAVRAHPAWPLLFDPQTSGGLLAAVPPDNAAACVAELRESGYRQATIIGRIRAASSSLVAVI